MPDGRAQSQQSGQRIENRFTSLLIMEVLWCAASLPILPEEMTFSLSPLTRPNPSWSAGGLAKCDGVLCVFIIRARYALLMEMIAHAI
jgi:hypothetical protein